MSETAAPIFFNSEQLGPGRWKINRQTIKRMKDSGELTAKRFGGSVRFDIDQIQAYEAANFVPDDTGGPQVLGDNPRRIFYSPNELAAILGLNRQTIYRMKDRGEVGFCWIRGQIRFPSEVVDWMSRHAA